MLVYRLYALTYDEVLIVDPETPITREEYEKIMEAKRNVIDVNIASKEGESINE